MNEAVVIQYDGARYYRKDFYDSLKEKIDTYQENSKNYISLLETKIGILESLNKTYCEEIAKLEKKCEAKEHIIQSSENIIKIQGDIIKKQKSVIEMTDKNRLDSKGDERNGSQS